MKASFKGLAAAALIAAMAAPGGAAAQDKFVRIGGGFAGTYPLFAAKLAELINAKVPGYRAQVVTGDTEASQVQLDQGDLEFNISYTFFTKKVFDGDGSLGVATPNVRAVITLYSSMLQPIVPKDSPVADLAEIDDTPSRVWLGVPNGIFHQLGEAALNAAGVTLDGVAEAGGVIETFGYPDTVQAFQDGRLDLTFYSGPAPYGLMLQLQDQPGFRLVSMTDEELAKLGEILPGIATATIPAGAYTGQTEDVQAAYYVNQLVTSTNAPDDLVYAVTKLMYEDFAEFHGIFAGSEEIDDKDPLELNKIPVHPAAERYFEEVGAL